MSLFSRFTNRQPSEAVNASGIVFTGARFNPRPTKILTDQVDEPIDSQEFPAEDSPYDVVFDAGFLGRKIEINTIEEFATLPLLFEEVIDDLQLGSHLGFSIQPALFGGLRGSSSARIALLVSSAYAMSDQVVEILKILSDEGRWKGSFKLWEHATRIVLPHGMMLALTRGEMNKDGLENRRKINIDPKKHAFYKVLEGIIEWGVKQNASDVHFNMNFSQENSEVRFTIDGRYVAPEQFKMPTQTLYQVLNVAWMAGTGGNGPSYDVRIEQQCRIALTVQNKPVMLRWASASTESPGPSVTTRIIRSDANVLTLEQLSYIPDQIATYNRAMNAEKGVIILAGVVNSGKSVTIAALLGRLPDHRKKMGIEDPVEILIPGMLQKSINRPLEGDTGREFDAIAKTAKRFAMNDILIGEIRDKATGVLMVDIVLMGTSVYTTTHSPTALGVFDKLSSDMVGVSRDFLSVPGNIKLITYQALIPSLCECALPLTDLTRQGGSQYSAEGTSYINRITHLYDLDVSAIKIRNGEGCPACRRAALPQLNGFSGRTLAAEMVEPDETLLTMVKKGDSIGMRRHTAELKGSTRYDAPQMEGKSAMECAVYKMSLGILDPREIEPRFHSFEREEMIRNSSRRHAEHVEQQVMASIRAGR